jgi:alanyl-tRNA synthetase
VLLLSADAQEGKVVIVAKVPKSLIAEGLKAGDWVKAAAQACGGGGGGRPDSAQAGGKDPARVEDAAEAARAHATASRVS